MYIIECLKDEFSSDFKSFLSLRCKFGVSFRGSRLSAKALVQKLETAIMC